MFINFFYYLRLRGLAPSIAEWRVLLQALVRGYGDFSLEGFYYLCRSACVKNEAKYDLYDQCFAEFFQGVTTSEELLKKFAEWLENPVFQAADPKDMEAWDIERLRREFEQRLREQHERHDGGSRWIGTGGTSPFGHSGYHPGGIRVGGSGQNRSAAQIAMKRQFANLRQDRILDTRQFVVALKKLRRLKEFGQEEELDLESTIDKTAKNYGDIDLVFRFTRKNNLKLLLLMDVGGSMTPYARLTESLFSAAAHAEHFKEFKHFYFHNCLYQTVFTDMEREIGFPTEDLFNNYHGKWVLLIVGDAAMHPYELLAKGGAIDYFNFNQEPGLSWLRRLKSHFPASIWLNPDPPEYWERTSTKLISQVFKMFPFTVQGLDDGIKEIKRGFRT